MIDKGLPRFRAEWPDGVLELLSQFVQGDLVANPPIGYFADPTSPIWEPSRRYAEQLSITNDTSEGDIIYFPDEALPPYGMITTQTCDLVEADSERPRWPWVQLIPVYDLEDQLNSGQKELLRKGVGQRILLHVPALESGFYVADFRLSFPVEKGWLAKQGRIDGFGTEELRQRVADRLAHLAGRPAFAGSFVSTIQQPLVDALKDLKRANAGGFKRFYETVVEVGTRIDSRLNPTTVQVVVICSKELSKDDLEWWNNWHDTCRQRATEVGITLQALDFKLLDGTFTAAEYRELTLIPLVNVSPD